MRAKKIIFVACFVVGLMVAMAAAVGYFVIQSWRQQSEAVDKASPPISTLSKPHDANKAPFPVPFEQVARRIVASYRAVRTLEQTVKGTRQDHSDSERIVFQAPSSLALYRLTGSKMRRVDVKLRKTEYVLKSGKWTAHPRSSGRFDPFLNFVQSSLFPGFLYDEALPTSTDLVTIASEPGGLLKIVDVDKRQVVDLDRRQMVSERHVLWLDRRSFFFRRLEATVPTGSVPNHYFVDLVFSEPKVNRRLTGEPFAVPRM